MRLDLLPDSDAATSEMAKGGFFDLVLLDIDLGKDSQNGFDVCNKLKALRATGLICVNSDRNMLADYSKAMAQGADAFLPKPISRIQ